MRVLDYVKTRTGNWGYVLGTSEIGEDRRTRLKKVAWSTTGKTYRQTDLSPCARNQTPATSGRQTVPGHPELADRGGVPRL